MQIRSFGGLKIWLSQGSAGSIPVLGTISSPFFKTRLHGGFFGSMETEANSVIFLLVLLLQPYGFDS